MNKIIEITTSAILPSIVAISIGVIGNLLTLEKGYLKVGGVLSVSGQNFVAVYIGNYSVKTLNGLQLAVPSELDGSKLVTSRPLRIERHDNVIDSASETLLTLSSFEPQSETVLLFPSIVTNPVGFPKLLNATEIGFEPSQTLVAESRWKRAFRNTWTNAAVSIFMFLCLIFWIEYRNIVRAEKSERNYEAVNQQFNRADAEVQRLQGDLEEMRRLARELKLKSSRVDILLMTRMRDYATELTFWRDTV